MNCTSTAGGLEWAVANRINPLAMLDSQGLIQLYYYLHSLAFGVKLFQNRHWEPVAVAARTHLQNAIQAGVRCRCSQVCHSAGMLTISLEVEV